MSSLFCTVRTIRNLVLTLVLLDALLKVTCQGQTRDDPRFKRPEGMTDAQYAKIMDSIRGKQMSKQQADDWWVKVQDWFKGIFARLKEAGQRIGTFFDKLFAPADTKNGSNGGQNGGQSGGSNSGQSGCSDCDSIATETNPFNRARVPGTQPSVDATSTGPNDNEVGVTQTNQPSSGTYPPTTPRTGAGTTLVISDT